ncbi:shikimate kinase [Nonomuraea sediminis]|uniref:shikimate kinase n=1 Tax=Nonomuraea sediminis TaxID=2835864 RepID=UPI00202A6A8C|nr:shikimate kinase [Nonomuraea sediminis]
MAKNKPIVVIGLMGSGKTTVGRLVSRALGLPFTDSDPYLQARYGASAAEMAASVGADVLHEREAAHVLDALDGEPKVIAAAASTVEDPRVREALHDAFVVWLDAPDGVLAERMKSGAHRPGFTPAAMRARRGAYLREVADLVLDMAASTPEIACRRITEAANQ